MSTPRVGIEPTYDYTVFDCFRGVERILLHFSDTLLEDCGVYAILTDLLTYFTAFWRELRRLLCTQRMSITCKYMHDHLWGVLWLALDCSYVGPFMGRSPIGPSLGQATYPRLHPMCAVGGVAWPSDGPIGVRPIMAHYSLSHGNASSLPELEILIISFSPSLYEDIDHNHTPSFIL